MNVTKIGKIKVCIYNKHNSPTVYYSVCKITQIIKIEFLKYSASVDINLLTISTKHDIL